MTLRHYVYFAVFAAAIEFAIGFGLSASDGARQALGFMYNVVGLVLLGWPFFLAGVNGRMLTLLRLRDTRIVAGET